MNQSSHRFVEVSIYGNPKTYHIDFLLSQLPETTECECKPNEEFYVQFLDQFKAVLAKIGNLRIVNDANKVVIKEEVDIKDVQVKEEVPEDNVEKEKEIPNDSAEIKQEVSDNNVEIKQEVLDDNVEIKQEVGKDVQIKRENENDSTSPAKKRRSE